MWRPIVEVLILWFVIYHIVIFFEGTRAVQVVRGIAMLLFAFFLFQKLNFIVLDWLLTKLFGISVIAILVIFHPEIRQGLARLGRRHFGANLREEELDYMLSQIGKAAENLCKNKLGGLIAIEKSDSLSTFIETGVIVEGRVSSELIEAIFTPNNPLHDGSIIIQHGRITAAGCLLPLTQNQDLSRVYGTRHRAALGLSEEADAIIIIISQERQDISLVYRGRLYKDLEQKILFSEVKEKIML